MNKKNISIPIDFLEYIEFSKKVHYASWLVDLVEMAVNEPTDVIFNGATFHLEQNQVVVSYPFLEKRWNVGREKIISYLKKMEDEKVLSLSKTNKGTVITLLV